MRQTDREIFIHARPHPIAIDSRATAVIVVDMQNDFGAEGGMFARAGIDISSIQAAVEPTARVLDAARQVGMPVVYLKMAFTPDLANAGAADAPNRILHHRLGVGEAVTAPDGRASRVLVSDTWNTEILSRLQPEPDDRIVTKHRFSGFFETNLDMLLKELAVDTLVFTGCTTSVCVESTVRDAFFRDYRCLVLEDCTAEPIGAHFERSNHAASLHVIEVMFGSISDATAFTRALAARPASIATA